MFERILLPLDGSPVAEAAIPFATRLPSREVLLLYVDAGGDGLLPSVATGQTLAARSYLDAIAPLFRQDGRRVEVAVECGEPAERIVDDARVTDVIVLATDGRGMGSKLVGGCTADRVARHAPAPTLLIRARDHTPRAAGFGRIVVPLDGSMAAEAALRPAARLASAMMLPMQLVRVYESGSAADARGAYLQDVTRRLETGVRVVAEMRRGDPATMLLAAVHPDDLIVMTTHGAGGMRRWFLGNVTERLIRRAPAPVLIAREAAPETVLLPVTDAPAQVWW
ncbi:MAG: universal stress protein [Thermomicrobiales bacterium]